MPTAPQSLGASEKTLIVLQAVTTHQRFTDIVDQTGLAKATTHRLLKTLEEYKFVTLTESGDYFPGPAALRLAGQAFGLIDISTIAAPHITRLAKETGYTVHIGAATDYQAIYIAKQNGPTPYRLPSRVGDRLELHSTSIGKSILAGLAPTELENTLNNLPFTRFTPNTITKRGALLQEIQKVRTQGFAIDDEENVPGLRCVGAPIFNHAGKVTHGISLTSLVMENPLERVENLAPTVQAAAKSISEALGAVSTSHN